MKRKLQTQMLFLLLTIVAFLPDIASALQEGAIGG